MISRIVACVCASALFSASAHAAEPSVTVLTGGSRGAFYPLGIALADNIAAALKIRASVQATRGVVESLDLLQAGRGEIAFASDDVLSDAWKGREEAGFKAPHDKLRGIAAIYPNYIHIVALADSGIRTLADVRGRRVSVGTRKSAIELNARALFAAAGLAYEDFAKVEYLPFGESVELLKNRQIDVMLQATDLGALALRDLARSVPIVIVAIPAEAVRKAGDPAYVSAAIPADTYPGQTADVPTVAVQNSLVTHEGVSDERVYAMTRALWTGLDQLVAAHAAAKAIDLKHALDNMPVPLHRGAEKYYREVGLIR